MFGIGKLVKELPSEHCWISSSHWGKTQHVLLIVGKVLRRGVEWVNVCNVHVEGVWCLGIIVCIKLQIDIDEVDWNRVEFMIKLEFYAINDGVQITNRAKDVGDSARRAKQELFKLFSLVPVFRELSIYRSSIFESSGHEI